MGILEDLNDLISYSWEDEERHFEETEEGENKENHIFNTLKRVKDWVDSPACPLISEEEFKTECLD